MVNRSSRKKSISEEDLMAAAVALGRLGGLKGGKARAAKLTAHERQEIARKGAQQRWSKHKKPVKTLPASNLEGFDIQKEAFQRIPASRLTPYEDQFVVSHNGQIIDSDYDLPTLTRRFFRRHPKKSVYITRIGGPAAIIGSPFAER